MAEEHTSVRQMAEEPTQMADVRTIVQRMACVPPAESPNPNFESISTSTAPYTGKCSDGITSINISQLFVVMTISGLRYIAHAVIDTIHDNTNTMSIGVIELHLRASGEGQPPNMKPYVASCETCMRVVFNDPFNTSDDGDVHQIKYDGIVVILDATNNGDVLPTYESLEACDACKSKGTDKNMSSRNCVSVQRDI